MQQLKQFSWLQRRVGGRQCG